KLSSARPASTITHSACGWSYQKPGGLACPRDTMRSMRTAGDDSSVVISSRASCPGMAANRFPPLGMIALLLATSCRNEPECLRQQLVGAPARRMIVDHGGDHHLV